MATEYQAARLSLARLLLTHGWSMATAESCTGGLVAAHLTALAGASAWFDHSVVTYSYTAKESFLGVQAETLAREGAVSAQCVEEMAQGLLSHSTVDVGLAISGIAGPDGGTADKPVGTVWFAFIKRGEAVLSLAQHFQGDREAIREQASAFAINQLYHYLRGFV